MNTITPYLANDKYRASLRSTWIATPADTSLAVTAIPTNFPAIITVGWGTDLQTVFSATGHSGSTPSDYALTGVTRLKGANQNLPAQTSINCLNHEEFFNQYGQSINDVINTVNSSVPNAAWVTVADGTTMALDLASGLNRKFKISPTVDRTLTITNPLTGTPFVVRITQPATARVITWFTGYTITWQGTDGVTNTAIALNKVGTYGFIVTGANTLDGFFMGSN